MTTLAWIASVLLTAIFLWVGAMNWMALVAQQLRPRAPSWIPLMAGTAGALALGIAPLPGVSQFWWVPFIVDGGSLPGFLMTAYFHLRRSSR